MKTKKHKSKEIPIIEQNIYELEIDLHNIKNPKAKQLIENEIKVQKERLERYKHDINQPNNRKPW